MVTGDLEARLSARTLELVDIPSESRHEAAIAAHVLGLLESGGVPVRDAGDDCLVAGEPQGQGGFELVLAGHFDTVPSQGNIPGEVIGSSVRGLGAADMKGALAVMVELALAGLPAGVGLVFFGREELPPADSALAPLLERDGALKASRLAVVMEPTANHVQAGCLGNLNASWSFSGRSGHSARPWLAENAIAALAEGVAELESREPVVHDFAGLEFREVFSVTSVEGGIARNVIPAQAQAHVNYRYPPGISPQEAEERIREACEPRGTLVIEANAPSGPVVTTGPLVEALIEASGAPAEPKQAWTPVAEFGAAGVPAVNYGPGDPVQAHRADEEVSAAALAACFSALSELCARAGAG